MADDKLIPRLRAVRHDYAAERIWHKFLLDAYAGTGGFMGRVRMPFSGYWGPASQIYSPRNTTLNATVGDLFESNLDTYLERFPREDMDKFARRHWVSQYPNYVEPIIDIRMSFMHRKEFQRSGTEGIVDWLDDADGTGTPWDVIRRETIDFRAALLGWCPVLFDRSTMPDVEPGTEVSVAQAQAAGVRVNAIPLFPANLLDWDTDERGDFVWVKTMQVEVVRPNPLGPAHAVERINIWTRDDVQKFEITRDSGGQESVALVDEIPHGYGFVPIIVAKHKRSHDSPVRGLPMAGGPSLLARKLFNYLSELDEHISASVFAFLQVPVKKLPQAGELQLGSGNALPIDQASSRDYKYISPDASVAATLETRVGVVVTEIYRVGRTEFARANAGSGGAESGTARAFAFENTNRAISDFAANMGAFDEAALRLVSFMQTGDTAGGSAIRVTPPLRFDVEQMSRELEEAITAVTIGLGGTANMELKLRLVQKLLPNLAPETRQVIEQELDSMRALEVAGAAADGALLVADETDETDETGPLSEAETETG